MQPIYLDYNGTTPVDPEVYQAMIPYLTEFFGNPSSSHIYGLRAKSAIEKSRKQISDLIHAKPEEITFTGSGTEANNLAIIGYVMANRSKGNHIITSAIEHPSVIEVCRSLEKVGYRISYITVDVTGTIDISVLEKEITSSTLLISIMHANNETGTIQPIEEIGRIAKKNKIAFHCDASQSTGKIVTDVNKLGVDLMTITGHKFYAPKGVGALYIRSGTVINGISYGAVQENGLRPGTENVKDIVALGKAAELAINGINEFNNLNRKLTEDLFHQLKSAIPEIRFNGHFTNRLPNTLNVSFPNILNGDLFREMPDVCVSAGAACHSELDHASYVITAMGVPEEYLKGVIRISTGKYTTQTEINEAAKEIIKAYRIVSGKGDFHSGIKTDIQMLDYTIHPGCSCKIDTESLDSLLKKMPVNTNPDILTDATFRDDAAVYRISDDIAIVQTVDFLTPMVNDPYIFGQIAAANAISDIYAMGARPLYALNIVGFPTSSLPLEILQKILAGASDKAKEAGVSITGGHSIEDAEPKFGMAVTGIIHPDRILKNSTARKGDAIILTKPIGCGIISHASKLKMAEEHSIEISIRQMGTLNKIILDLISEFDIHACTDVTGFGLSGHLHEMASASELDAKVNFDKIPVISGVEELSLAKLYPKSTLNNYQNAQNFTIWSADIPDYKKYIFCDAQTSGGLLISISTEKEKEILKYLIDKGVSEASCIGYFTSEGNGKIHVD
jgi:selenium donor protein